MRTIVVIQSVSNFPSEYDIIVLIFGIYVLSAKNIMIKYV